MCLYVIANCTISKIGVFSGDGLGRFLMYTLLAVVVSVFGPQRGMFDGLLWTHACVGLAGYVSPMALTLGLESMFCSLWNSDRVEHARAPMLMFLMFIAALITYAGLSGVSANLTTILLSSLFIAISITDRILFVGVGSRSSLSIVSEPCPSSSVVKRDNPCSFVTSEPVCFYPSLLLETGSMTEPLFDVIGEGDEYSAIPCKESPISRVTTSASPSNMDDSGIFEPPQAASGTRNWFYLDLKGSVQGPFATETMKCWFRANLLPPDLLVANSPEPSAFAPLSQSPEQFVD